MTKKCAFHVLGCKVNQNEVEALKNIFQEAGYEVVPFDEKADVYVIHTCTVTHISDRKSRQFIRKANKTNPDAIIAVTGCYAQVSPEDVAKIPGVDIIIGTNERYKILELIEEKRKKADLINIVQESKTYRDFEELPLVTPDRARAFIKIQEGCDRFCTYCIIPYARGPVRSRKPENIIEEIKELIKKGYSEIILTGIHTALYGKDFKNTKIDLAWLIEKIVQVPGLKRLRISSIDPDDFNERLLKVTTESEIVCPHYHISLQSGDNTILKKMGRKYTTEDFYELVTKIREKRPDASITTDIMVGFPGEGEKEFENTFNFIKKVGFSDLHVFKYSPRKGTPAAKMKEQVDAKIKNARSEKLLQLSKELFNNYAKKFLNKRKEVLVEKNVEGAFWEGHTANYLPVRFTAPQDVDLSGHYVDVYLKEIAEKKVLGNCDNL